MDDRLQEINDEVNGLLNEYYSIVKKKAPLKGLVVVHLNKTTWIKSLMG